MKALTISQPFASLIAGGTKWIENRNWETSYRGQIAIHAGKGTQYLTRSELAEYPTSKVIAVAWLVACVPLSVIEDKAKSLEMRRKIPGTKRTWEEAAKHRHAEGPYCWILDDVHRLEMPVEIAGKQGLWNWQD